MRFSILLIAVVCLNGCWRQPAPPTPKLRPIAKISARVHAVPEWRTSAIDRVEVPEEQMAAFAILITPTEPCVQNIDSKIHYHVADVFLQHKDGSTTTLIVRWTGHNPAAISLDGRNYYYGGSDDFPDGATRILRLLHEYHYQSRK
jgi:hypothetical protein